jgi:hypothetical protein
MLIARMILHMLKTTTDLIGMNRQENTAVQDEASFWRRLVSEIVFDKARLTDPNIILHNQFENVNISDYLLLPHLLFSESSNKSPVSSILLTPWYLRSIALLLINVRELMTLPFQRIRIYFSQSWGKYF